MLDHFVESEATFPPSITAGYAIPVRRHLAIVDQSRLRCDCLKLALAQQPRRWRVTDTVAASELARLVQRGEEFDVILLGGSTCAHIDLDAIAMLAAERRVPRSLWRPNATTRTGRMPSFAPAREASSRRAMVSKF